MIFTEDQERVIATRFWEMVERGEGCWLWQGTKTPSGYGKFQHRGLSMWAHRLAFILTRGPIPDGLFVLHSCDVRPCVNPDHLRVGTQQENMADMIAKGRHRPNYTGNPGPMPEDRRLRLVNIRRSDEQRAIAAATMKRSWEEGKIVRERAEFCPLGHPKEEMSGEWSCRECGRQASREYQRRRRRQERAG